jgi:hypothetical protein
MGLIEILILAKLIAGLAEAAALKDPNITKEDLDAVDRKVAEKKLAWEESKK